MIRVSVIGDDAVRLRLGRGAQNLRNLRPLLARIGQGLRRSFTLNFTSGRGPNGETLPPVQRWTRLLAGKQPYAKVLHSTGSLRRSIGPLSVSATRLVFGFHGNFSSVASAQTLGTPGRIKVAQKILSRLRRDAAANARKSERIYEAGKTYRRLDARTDRAVAKLSALRDELVGQMATAGQLAERAKFKVRRGDHAGRAIKSLRKEAFKLQKRRVREISREIRALQRSSMRLEERTATARERRDERVSGIKAKSRKTMGGINSSGIPYIRVKSDTGGWFTKQVIGGYVSVRPRPRRFFYLGRKDIAMIRREALAYLARL